MMIFNKKLAATVLLFGIFGQAAAMKRLNDVSGQNNPSKRPKTSHPVFVIPSSFTPSEQLLKTEPESIKKPYAAVIDLSISTQEQSEFYTKKIFPHHDQKFCSALSRRDTDQANYHMQKLAQSDYTNGIVSEIVLSELPQQEKKSLFDQLQKDTKNQSQAIIFNQPNAYGHTPLQSTAMYDDYPLAHDLLQRGADSTRRDAKGRPILFDIQSVEMGKLFVAYGANIKQIDAKGRTLLHENASNDPKDIEIATWAITHGVPVNRKNVYGQTAYQEQVMHGGANQALSQEKLAFEMTRKNLGINPLGLRAIQTGQFRLKKS